MGATVDPPNLLDDPDTMGRGAKLLEKMRANPRDWRIDDAVSVCEAFDVACTAPSEASHYKVKHEGQREILTIPAHRPIKAVYIRDLVDFLDRAIEART